MTAQEARRLQDIKDYVGAGDYFYQSVHVKKDDFHWLIDRIEALEKKAALLEAKYESREEIDW